MTTTSTGLRGKRGPYARTLVRRRLIANAVLDLVDEVGPEAVTTSHVAERSGIPEASVLYHFPTKDDLLVAACEQALEVSAELYRVDDVELRLDLDKFIEIYRPSSPADPRFRLGQIVRGLAAMPGTTAAEFFRRRTQRQVEIFTRLFEKRVSDGLARPDADAGLLARQVIALWEGLESVFANDAEVDTAYVLADAIRRLSGAPDVRASADQDPCSGSVPKTH